MPDTAIAEGMAVCDLKPEGEACSILLAYAGKPEGGMAGRKSSFVQQVIARFEQLRDAPSVWNRRLDTCHETNNSKLLLPLLR